MAIERITVLSVPVDVIRVEQFEEVLLSMAEKPGAKQIIFLSVWDLLFARMNPEFLICLKNADLILPVSKSIITGAAFLKKTVPVRYNPFSAIISIMSVLDVHYKSLYLLGSTKKSLLQAERNVHFTFPGLQIVGRYVGFYPKDSEKDIIQAIYKASPSLVLLGSGLPGKARWAYRRRNSFKSSIFLWDKDVIEVFSKRKKRVSPAMFEKGMEIWSEILRNPFKIFLIFPFLWYKLLLLYYRLFRRGQ